jgi:hypothetical protein
VSTTLSRIRRFNKEQLESDVGTGWDEEATAGDMLALGRSCKPPAVPLTHDALPEFTFTFLDECHWAFGACQCEADVGGDAPPSSNLPVRSLSPAGPPRTNLSRADTA